MVAGKENELRGYMPKEGTKSTENARLIESPKGKMSSRDAWKLQQVINNQLKQEPTSPIAEPGRQMTYKK